MREMNHRIANSLQLVASTIQLQSAAAGSAEARAALGAALARVVAIGRVHRRLHREAAGAELALGPYLAETCRDIAAQVGGEAACQVACDEIEVGKDAAFKLGMIVNELVVNAFKHAGAARAVAVECRAAGDALSLKVADGGPGFPAGFDPARSKGLGMKIVTALTEELGGRLELHRGERRGTVELVVPRAALAAGA
jgi:two-component sensor histidine kinase